ncbi:hypothetical protein HW115_14415 [Verrucomicrobiaceae bacterium N1E253]|uniref:Lipopolysaccharide kinase n=1 Tax=Oceaniferula marina TaxID=2748318 RepID=A0A851GH04_9BACT|nr:lipopolysaccharide kinase InaA family protein [Oceaniferula marina]NWK56813.1 hypothetical protein [Oceaniferula marina]
MPSTPDSYTHPEWSAGLIDAGYASFDDWWNAEQNLVEVGNFRGPDANTSWSHVSRIELPDGRTVYLKRQQNHFPNNTLLKLRRICTFEIEYQNYLKLQEAGVPTMKIIHFATRKVNGDKQCIIVSEELKGMSPVDTLIKSFEATQWPSRKDRLAMLQAVVKVVKTMHRAGLIHNALYGRHIYLNIPIVEGRPQLPESYNACLIDLERTKSPGPKSPKLIKNDLEKMFRRIRQWPARDCLWFLKQYLGIDKLTPEAKAIARKIAATRK